MKNVSHYENFSPLSFLKDLNDFFDDTSTRRKFPYLKIPYWFKESIHIYYKKNHVDKVFYSAFKLHL